MKKINLRYLYERTKELVISPDRTWPVINDEYTGVKEIFQTYLIPLSVIISVIVLLFGFLQYTVWQTICYAGINFISAVGGTWLSFLICREYLNNKVDESENTALSLTVYSSAVFIVFHSLATAFGNGFFGQLMSLCSLLFIRTLYIGINKNNNLQAAYKKNLLIISILSIICIPMIIKKLLMILFHIPAFNL